MTQHRAAAPRGFDRTEFERRIARAQARMRACRLDGLLFTTAHNIRWATGFDSQFWESPTRPWFVVVPAEGQPVAVIPEIGAPQMAETWVDDIRTSSRPVAVNLDEVRATLDSLLRKKQELEVETRAAIEACRALPDG